MNQEFPIPWVNSAIVSAFTDCMVFLDGHSNPGFSGGPVVRDDVSDVQVFAVVSGYQYDRQRVLDGDGDEGPYTYDVNYWHRHRFRRGTHHGDRVEQPCWLPDSVVPSSLEER